MHVYKYENGEKHHCNTHIEEGHIEQKMIYMRFDVLIIRKKGKFNKFRTTKE